MRVKLGKYLLLILLIIIIGCTQKDNPVGYDPVDEPRYMELGDDVFENYYSYEDSVSNYFNSSLLTIGNNEEYEMKTLIRFYGLPDSLAELESEDISFKLVVNKGTGNYMTSYQAGRINQYWEQNYVTYQSATDSLDWEDAFEEAFFSFDITEEYSNSDTMEINFPAAEFYHYENEKYYADSLLSNYGMYLEKSSIDEAASDFIEFYSYESDSEKQPSLSFNYKSDIDDEEFSTWESGTVYDTNLYDSQSSDLEEYEVYPGELMLRNISPVKMFIGMDLSYEKFTTDSLNTGITTIDDFHKMTINKATLVLSATEFYGSNDYVYSQPAVLTDTSFVDTPDNNEIPVYEDHYDLVSGVSTTQDSLETDQNYYKMDVTSEVQAMITDNDDIDGYGLIIRSLRENRDFSYIKFNTPDAEEGLRPYLQIYYTLPLEP